MEFKDMFELKERIMPALNKRVGDLRHRGIDITCDDIFDDLKVNKWSRGSGLALNEIVDDILKYEPALEREYY